MQEIWKEVFIDGVYTGRNVSNLGRLSDSNGNILRLYDNGSGYMAANMGIYVNSKGNRNSKFIYIHRLVAMYFLPNPFNYPQVNHKDCDKSNNHVDNLEWITRKANIDHAHESGRMRKRKEHGSIIMLTPEQVIECYARVKLGDGVNTVAKSMGKSRTTISSIINKRSRRDITDRLDAIMNELQRIQQEYLEQYERGEITYEEYEAFCIAAYIDFNND